MSNVITQNKKAFHNYEIFQTYEAGLVLNGDEIKSIRAGQVNISDAFATVRDGELMLINCNISAYTHAYSKEDRSLRTRKLLLHRREINKIIGEMSRKGLTLVPLKLYFNERGYVKVQLGLAKHKKAAGKKQELRERDIKRQAEREVKIRVR